MAGKPPFLLASRGELKEDRSDLRQQGQNQRYSIEVVLVVALVKTKPTLASFVRDPSLCVLLAPQGLPFRFFSESRRLPETKFRPKFRRNSLIPNRKGLQIQKTKFR